MYPYRVGIIGCGGIANAHVNGYKDLGLDIVAAADIRQEQLDEFKKHYGIKSLYKNYTKMLSKEKLDLVSICTWPILHAKMTVDAADAGVKGILCEKPMAMNLAEADMMIEACDKAGAKLTIGHMRRFSDIYVEARNLASSKAVGDINFLHGISVGDLLSDGTHIVDLIRFLAGDQPVNWVIGQIDAHEKRKRFGHYIEDAAVCYLEFKNGVRAFIEVSGLTGSQLKTGNIGFTDESLFKDLDRVRAVSWWKKSVKYCTAHIYGTEGWIAVGEREQPPLKLKGKGDTDWRVPRFDKTTDPFRREIEVLIESIEKNFEHPCSGRQGRETLEVLMAVFESSRRRETIIFPLKAQDYPLATMIEKGEI